MVTLFFFSYHYYHSARYLASIFNIQMQAKFLKPKLTTVLILQYPKVYLIVIKKYDHLELGMLNVSCKWMPNQLIK